MKKILVVLSIVAIAVVAFQAIADSPAKHDSSMVTVEEIGDLVQRYERGSAEKSVRGTSLLGNTTLLTNWLNGPWPPGTFTGFQFSSAGGDFPAAWYPFTVVSVYGFVRSQGTTPPPSAHFGLQRDIGTPGLVTAMAPAATSGGWLSITVPPGFVVNSGAFRHGIDLYTGGGAATINIGAGAIPTASGTPALLDNEVWFTAGAGGSFPVVIGSNYFVWAQGAVVTGAGVPVELMKMSID